MFTEAASYDLLLRGFDRPSVCRTRDRHQQYERETGRDSKGWRRTRPTVGRGDERPDSPSRGPGQVLKYCVMRAVETLAPPFTSG